MSEEHQLPSTRSLLLCAENKSGMKHIDRAHVDKIILEASKGSAFLENEIRKSKYTNKKISQMKQAIYQFKNLPKSIQQSAETQALSYIKRLQLNELSSVYMHLDIDMFFCAVEIKDNPELANIPMVVGDIHMISTANYIARTYGVRAAMPGFIAMKLCPHLTFVSANYKKYNAVGSIVRKVLSQFDSNVIATSCDEASLDLTPYLKETNSVNACEIKRVVENIRTQVYIATGGLTCSAGVANSRMLAKICSNENKPNGQFILQPENVSSFLAQLPFRNIPGIGKFRERLLHETLNIVTCNDIVKNACLILQLFSDKTSEFFIRSALGLDSPTQTACGSQKSLSCERTFKPTNCFHSLRQTLKFLSNKLHKCLEKEAVETKHISLKIKLSDFTVRNISKQLSKRTHSESVLFKVAQDLLVDALPSFGVQKNNSVPQTGPFFWPPKMNKTQPTIRLLGLRATELVSSEGTQAMLSSFSQNITPNNLLSSGIIKNKHLSGMTDTALKCSQSITNAAVNESRVTFSGVEKSSISNKIELVKESYEAVKENTTGELGEETFSHKGFQLITKCRRRRKRKKLLHLTAVPALQISIIPTPGFSNSASKKAN